MFVIEKYLLPSDRAIQNIDFTIECEHPLIDKTIYIKGRKVETNYYTFCEKLGVKKTFSDIYENGTFVGVNIKIDWFNNDGSIGYTKVVAKRMGTGVAFDYLRKRRQRTISYLQIASKGTPIENYVVTLLKHYKNEVDLFIQSGSNDFEEAVLNETESSINKMLNIVIDKDGKTVKDSILYQITND